MTSHVLINRINYLRPQTVTRTCITQRHYACVDAVKNTGMSDEVKLQPKVVEREGTEAFDFSKLLLIPLNKPILNPYCY